MTPKIRDEDVEYRTQPHLMDVEGCMDYRPYEEEILAHGEKRGFFVTGIDIFYDTMQGVWRYNGKITPIKILNQ